MHAQITPAILTLNEEANVGRCLEMLSWAKRVVVVDSGSTDRTEQICRSFPNVEFFTRRFDIPAAQWTFALRDTGIETDWVLAIDADYILSPAFIEELARLSPTDDIGGYRCHFQFVLKGRIIRSAFYPPVVALYRQRDAHYIQDGHKMVVQTPGEIVPMAAPLAHDDRKPLARWLSTQATYAPWEADKMVNTPMSRWEFKYFLRGLVPISPIAVAFYVMIVRLGFLDGRGGLYYCFQRVIAEALICLHYMDRVWPRGPR